MKSERQNRILELVEKYEIETQEEMINRLRSEGYMVTQATVSRDLKELKLTKTLTSQGTYCYSVSNRVVRTGNVNLNTAMAESIIGVDHSCNNVVVKTYPGLAQAVASSIDAMDLSGILGCVAGDDTIIIVTRNEESSANISAKLKELIKTL